MRRFERSRLWLVGAYIAVCTLLVVLSSFLADAALMFWQSRHLDQGSYFIPVGRRSTYFYLLACPACYYIARVTGRANRLLATACILAWPATIVQLLFWAKVASVLGGHPSPADYERLDVELLPGSAIVVTALTVTTELSFFAGMFLSLLRRPVWESTPPESAQTSGEPT